MSQSVGIWGSYNHGNFGDDLMAVDFALSLKKAGFDPIVYRLDESISEEFNVRSSQSIDEIVKCHRVILGGGGFLVPDSGIKILLSKVARDFEIDFWKMYLKLRNSDRTMYCYSIGGDGSTAGDLSLVRRLLFSSKNVKIRTHRLRNDVVMIDGLRSDESFYVPDVVLATSLIHQKTVKDNDSHIVLVINLFKRNADEILKMIPEALDKKIKIIFIQSHLSKYNQDYEVDEQYIRSNYPSVLEMPNIDYYRYESLGGMLDILSNCDAIISSKLHLGIAAMSYGAKFYSFDGKGKAKEALREYGMESQIFSPGQAKDLLEEFTQYCKAKPIKSIPSISTEACAHYDLLIEDMKIA